MKKDDKKLKKENIKESETVDNDKKESVVKPEGEIVEFEKKAEEYLVGWKRCQADFENYKKMQNEAQKDMIRYAAQNILLEIIPVVDNFHAATAHIPKGQESDGWVTGIMYIQKQLENVLSENGVSEIMVKEGDNFNPVLHEALEGEKCEHCADGNKFENKIKKIVQKGYKIGERIIRPVKVVVE